MTMANQYTVRWRDIWGYKAVRDHFTASVVVVKRKETLKPETMKHSVHPRVGRELNNIIFIIIFTAYGVVLPTAQS